MHFLNAKNLFKISYCYLALPLFLFICSWLNLFAALPLALLFILAFYKISSNLSPLDLDWKITPKSFSFFALFAAIWCFCAGIGYFYYQSFDYHFRNAVFRDLINYDWPIFYDKADTPIVYYVGFWIIPAFLGKITAFFIHNAYWNFYIANIFLLIYAVLGVVLIFAHLSLALKLNDCKKNLMAALLFIFFSGLDAVGVLIFQPSDHPFMYFDLHLEWWAAFIQYSSFTTALFWVFNQFIPIALITLLFFNERNIKHFAFFVVLALFFSPYSASSIGIFLLAFAFKKLYSAKNKIDFFCEHFFSIPNIIFSFFLLPVVILYFITNSGGIDRFEYIFSSVSYSFFIAFLLLEFLLYAFILMPIYKKHFFFVSAIILLCLIPFFRFDQQNNFCMRASLAPLIILSVYVFRFIFSKNYNLWMKTPLICLLIIAAVTPCFEFYRTFAFIHKAHKIDLVADGIYTLNQKNVIMPDYLGRINHQFEAKDYRSDIFWQYLAKKH